MNLFENEVVNISKIYTVNQYESDRNAAVKNFPLNLNTYELIFFLSGERETVFGDKKLIEQPYSVRYLPKGISTGIYRVKTIVPGTCIDIYFDTDEAMPEHALNLKNMNEIRPLFLKIYSVWNSKKPGFYVESMSILYEIIKSIKHHNAKYSTYNHKEKIQPSYEYMIEHFSDCDFNYKTMCQKSKLSYDYFKELFIKHYGMSPVKYVTMLRIEKAKELLITRLYSVTEVSELCGFDNVYYFSNVFKKHVGISPGKYGLS